MNLRRGFATPLLIGIIALVLLAAGSGFYISRQSSSNPLGGGQEGSTARETPPAQSTYEICVARCRDQYGGSGSAGFDACVRACGASRPGEASAGRTGGGAGDMMEKGDAMIGKEGEMMKGESMAKYSGTVLAGTQAPLLDYTKADYDAALKSGKLLILYFYANWCPICKREVPDLETAFNELTTDKVIGFRVNYNDSDTDQNEKDLARELGVAYQHTKVFLKNGVQVLKAPDSWDKSRYLSEITKSL